MSKPIRTCIRIFILLNLIPISLSTIGLIHNSFDYSNIVNVIGISYLIGLPVPLLMLILIYFKPSRL